MSAPGPWQAMRWWQIAGMTASDAVESGTDDPMAEAITRIEAADGTAVLSCHDLATIQPDDAALICAAPEMLAVLRDVAALLPCSARLHPQDLLKLQTRVVAIIAKAAP